MRSVGIRLKKSRKRLVGRNRTGRRMSRGVTSAGGGLRRRRKKKKKKVTC